MRPFRDQVEELMKKGLACQTPLSIYLDHIQREKLGAREGGAVAAVTKAPQGRDGSACHRSHHFLAWPRFFLPHALIILPIKPHAVESKTSALPQNLIMKGLVCHWVQHGVRQVMRAM